MVFNEKIEFKKLIYKVTKRTFLLLLISFKILKIYINLTQSKITECTCDRTDRRVRLRIKRLKVWTLYGAPYYQIF